MSLMGSTAPGIIWLRGLCHGYTDSDAVNFDPDPFGGFKQELL